MAQLRKAGISANKNDLTLSHLTETLTLDAGTHQIKSHQLKFRFLIPYGNQNITYERDVAEEVQGIFDGSIELPAGVS